MKSGLPNQLVIKLEEEVRRLEERVHNKKVDVYNLEEKLDAKRADLAKARQWREQEDAKHEA